MNGDKAITPTGIRIRIQNTYAERMYPNNPITSNNPTKVIIKNHVIVCVALQVFDEGLQHFSNMNCLTYQVMKNFTVTTTGSKGEKSSPTHNRI